MNIWAFMDAPQLEWCCGTHYYSEKIVLCLFKHLLHKQIHADNTLSISIIYYHVPLKRR